MRRTGVTPHPKVWDAVKSLQELGYTLPGRAIRRKWGVKATEQHIFMVRRHTICLDVMAIDKCDGTVDYRGTRLPV